MTKTSTSAGSVTTNHNEDYQLLVGAIKKVVPNGPIFTTNVEDLFKVYLDNIPSEHRQHYNCNSCRGFIDKFGGLVTITPFGKTESAIWDEETTSEFFKPAIKAMLKVIKRAKVTGVFLSKELVWGTPITGEWKHLAITNPPVFKSMVQTAYQGIAEKKEDYKNINRALAEFSVSTLNTAINLLSSEALYRSEKVVGVANWLKTLHSARTGLKGEARNNVTWLAVATAPAGFCHPRSSMIGTLLDDIAGGMKLEEVKARFAAKMRPDQYQRPQAPPKLGNINQAERLVEQMGVKNSLKRRFARLEEIQSQSIWTPTNTQDNSSGEGEGVFSHLRQRVLPQSSNLVPKVTMTFEKFRRTVLPDAVRIEYLVPNSGNFSALVTAVDPDAPPIIQWDFEAFRNPFSWYVYIGGSAAIQWGLAAGSWAKVNAVTLQPSMWGDEDTFKHHGKSVFFILDGAKDTKGSDLALFPEILKSELHSIRFTIEGFSRAGRMEGKDEASACGFRLQAGYTWREKLRVTNREGNTTEYTLDRWD